MPHFWQHLAPFWLLLGSLVSLLARFWLMGGITLRVLFCLKYSINPCTKLRCPAPGRPKINNKSTWVACGLRFASLGLHVRSLGQKFIKHGSRLFSFGVILESFFGARAVFLGSRRAAGHWTHFYCVLVSQNSGLSESMASHWSRTGRLSSFDSLCVVQRESKEERRLYGRTLWAHLFFRYITYLPNLPT